MRGARPEWVDSAELAVSELVTNAVLHAHTAIHVRAVVTDSRLTVEVRDFSPVMPTAREWGVQAPTGRGMTLVASVTTDHGVIPLQPHGKVVWFRLADRGPEHAATEAQALLDLWDPAESDGHLVILQDFPPALWLAARQHHDAILRDLALYLDGHPNATISTEGRAAADLARLTISASLDQALVQHPSMPRVLDLQVVVPADRRDTFPVLQDVLDEAERLAAAELLLVRPALPEIVALRDWACDQVLAQCKGAPSVPWTGAEAHVFANTSAPVRLPAWDTREVTDSELMLVAADDANRILAVSRSLAQALGWQADTLRGRRLVTIVPPALREAHVVGFTRFLATGVRHVLGQPVDLPVLHADGRELPARLLINARTAHDGRSVFVAEFSLQAG